MNLQARFPRHPNNSLCVDELEYQLVEFTTRHIWPSLTHPFARIKAEGVPPVYELWSDVSLDYGMTHQVTHLTQPFGG